MNKVYKIWHETTRHNTTSRYGIVKLCVISIYLPLFITITAHKWYYAINRGDFGQVNVYIMEYERTIIRCAKWVCLRCEIFPYFTATFTQNMYQIYNHINRWLNRCYQLSIIHILILIFVHFQLGKKKEKKYCPGKQSYYISRYSSKPTSRNTVHYILLRVHCKRRITNIIFSAEIAYSQRRLNVRCSLIMSIHFNAISTHTFRPMKWRHRVNIIIEFVITNFIFRWNTLYIHRSQIPERPHRAHLNQIYWQPMFNIQKLFE